MDEDQIDEMFQNLQSLITESTNKIVEKLSTIDARLESAVNHLSTIASNTKK